MTKYYDEFENEISESEIDLELGYITQRSRVCGKIDAVEGSDEVFHYYVKNVYFKNGTPELNLNESCPYIITVDNQRGVFKWDTEKDPKHRVYHGMEIAKIIDSPRVEPSPEKDKYETINVYIKYTEEELAEAIAAKNEQDRINEILSTTLDRFETNEEAIIDLANEAAGNSDSIEELTQAILELAALIGKE